MYSPFDSIKPVFMVADPLGKPPKKWGGGVKDRAIKEKKTIFGTFFFPTSNVPTALSSKGEGG